MQNLEKISEELFAKIRGRFPSVTIGTEEGAITNNPSEARFIEFDYKSKGKVSLSLDEDDGLVIMHGADILAGENEEELSDWYSFLKELRVFAKKRMLNFDIRDITKSNLNKRDYNFLAKTSGEENMTESKMYGTSRMSYQDVDSARLVVKHTGPVNQELASGRTKSIGAIYIESAEGERFKYPFKHLSAARAMARHVAEGGKPFDDFGNHITGLSEELAKLRKFKTYMGRSAVMAEGLEPYMDAVKERMTTVKKTIESLQKQKSYKEMVENFEIQEVTEVPEDIRENWIEQLTIKQFNEELQDVFPYIYKLVGEATLAEELGPDDLVDEGERHGNSKIYDKCRDGWKKKPGATRGSKGSCIPEEIALEQAFEEMMGQFAEADGKDHDDDGDIDSDDYMAAKDKAIKKAMGNDEEEAVKEQKTPIGEFILSYYDRETGTFPKGETAVLTMIEKDYGDQYVRPAQAFIEKVHETFVQHERMSHEQNDILALAGI